MPKYIPKPRGRSHSERRQDTREQRKRFLIVCEGKETEPGYFKGFQREFRTLIDVEIFGDGFNTESLVEQAVEKRKKAERDGSFDECWCVFDKDDFSLHQFNNAIRNAENAGFEVAYSNQSFELWYLLHFQFLESALHRNQYNQRLTHHLGEQYQKDASSSGKMYDLLRSKMMVAIKNAERLQRIHQGKTNGDSDPCTTVHLLVKSLLKEAEALG